MVVGLGLGSRATSDLANRGSEPQPTLLDVGVAMGPMYFLAFARVRA